MSKKKYNLWRELETNDLYKITELEEDHLDIKHAAKVTKKKRGLDIGLKYYCYKDKSERLALDKNFWVLDVGDPPGHIIVHNQKDPNQGIEIEHEKNEEGLKIGIKKGIKTLLSKLKLSSKGF